MYVVIPIFGTILLFFLTVKTDILSKNNKMGGNIGIFFYIRLFSDFFAVYPPKRPFMTLRIALLTLRLCICWVLKSRWENAKLICGNA
jgi:hypothetical protein